MVISENCCNFKVLKIKSLQTIIAMITENKVTEIFCIADDFCKVFLQRICMCASSTFVSQGCVIQSFCGTPEDHCYSFGNLYKEGAFGKMYWHKFRGLYPSSCMQEPKNPYS